MLYNDMLSKYDALGGKQKKYMEFINDLQIQMEVRKS